MVAEPVRSSPLHAPFFSIYLDLFRFGAALVVVMGHMLQAGFDAPIFFAAGRAAHEAVIVFFVISGLVIAHSTFDKSRGLKVYAASRISRLYVVIVPALLVSILLADFIDPQGWAETANRRADWSLLDIPATLLFLTESWDSRTEMPFNPPFWSLCYEAWYYMMFALAVFVRSVWRWPLVLLAALIAGPAILLLAPTWLAGVWLYANAERWRIGRPLLLALLTLAVMAAVKLSPAARFFFLELSQALPWWSMLGESRLMVTDLAIGFLFALHLLAVRNVDAGWFRHLLLKAERPIRWLAGGTFTLYLFHWPVVYLLGGEPFTELHGPLGATAVLIGVTLLCVLIGQYLEQNGTRWLRGLLLGARQGERQIRTG